MHPKFLHAFSIRLFGYLLIMQPTIVLCQTQFSENYFIVADTWRDYCPGPEDAIRTLHAVSRTKCASECSFSTQCIDFSYYATSRLCYFYGFIPQKIFYDSECTFMMKLDPLSGFPISGPALLSTFDNWIVLMHRFDGSLDFYRNWTEYRNGFGDIGRGEFWLGNEKIHRLTNRTGLAYSLRIEVQLNTTGRWYYADYATFSLDSEENKYAIHVSGFSGNAGDSLSNTSVQYYQYQNGMSFTTMDADNDRSTRNCAQLNTGGYWFNDCYHCCLTCGGSAFKWSYSLSWQTSGKLLAARMMIQSK